MQDTLTPWYPPHIKPVHVGVYETDAEPNDFPGSGSCYQYWDGSLWGYCSDKTDFFLCPNDGYVSRYQSPRWRGLAYPPEKRA